MARRQHDDPKREFLSRSGTLHPHPDRVSEELFVDNLFFDSRDGVQVKYEMLRRVRVDGRSIRQAATAFGLSRPTYYEAHAAFARAGLCGLLPAKKGPKRAHKLSAEVLAFVAGRLQTQPDLKPPELAERIRKRFGVRVHPKSIRRALAHREKKRRSPDAGS